MTNQRLFIGAIAKRAGLKTATIRYYETIGLLPQTERGENRYRLYSTETVELLQFIAKAKSLGLTLSEVKEIVEVKQMGRAPCVHVKALLDSKIAEIDRRIADLCTLRKRLNRLSSGWTRQGGRRGSTTSICPHIDRVKPYTRQARTASRAAFS
jgi:DNA-binding transcriptional MerR regulator